MLAFVYIILNVICIINDASIKHTTITSYSDGSFGFKDLYVVSVFPGKIQNQDANHTGHIIIFVNYYYIDSIIGTTNDRLFAYDGRVMNAIYNSSTKSYTSIKPVTVAYPVEILYI